MPAFAETKMVLVSSAGSHGLGKSAVDLLDAVLEKPLRQQDLLDCLVKLFVGRGAQNGTASLEEPAPPVVRRVLPSTAALNILLVEDNRINQQFALALLNKAGHAVTVADNGHKAVDAVRKREFDVVLMDIQMPELDGIEATKQIRALPAPACNAYIIAMTANAMTGAREEYLAAGMNDYVSKPIDAQVLLSRLARLPARLRPQPAEPEAVADAAEADSIEIAKLDELARYLPVSGVVDLVSLFTAESNGHAMRIKNHLAEKDYPNIAREAHILVSTAGNIGAMHLSATARRLEQACKNDRLEELGRLVGELDRDISAANAGFSRWIAENQQAAQKRVS